MLLLRRRENELERMPEGYITDGLVLWLDGLDRGGVSGQWIDKIDAQNIVTLTGATEITNGVTFTNSGSTASSYGTFSKKVSVLYNVGTIESVTTLNATEVTGRTLMSMEDYGSLGGSVASSGTDGYPVSRYYNSNGDVSAYKFTNLQPTVKLIISANNDYAYCNGSEGTKYNTGSPFTPGSGLYLARKGNTSNLFAGTIHAIRIYNRKLSREEMLHNQALDNIRYSMGLTI